MNSHNPLFDRRGELISTGNDGGSGGTSMNQPRQGTTTAMLEQRLDACIRDLSEDISRRHQFEQLSGGAGGAGGDAASSSTGGGGESQPLPSGFDPVGQAAGSAADAFAQAFVNRFSGLEKGDGSNMPQMPNQPPSNFPHPNEMAALVGVEGNTSFPPSGMGGQGLGMGIDAMYPMGMTSMPFNMGAMMCGTANSMMMPNPYGMPMSMSMMEQFYLQQQQGMGYPGGGSMMMPSMVQSTAPQQLDSLDGELKAESRPRRSAQNQDYPSNEELTKNSKGPFGQIKKPYALALTEDKDWLTPLHCFIRKHCVEVFTATELDVATPQKGKRKPISVDQVGIRCPHCHEGCVEADPNRDRGSVYFPSNLSSVYNATMNLLQRHLNACPKVSTEIMDEYNALRNDDARSGTSKKYWVQSAKSLGFVDTFEGIKIIEANIVTRPPDVEKFSVKGKKSGNDEGDKKDHAGEETDVMGEKKIKDDPFKDAPPLVIEADKSTTTSFAWIILSQMQPCVFTEADRLGKRKNLTTGFAGLACRHCFGGYGSGRFFPSSIKTLSDTSKTLNVLHNHLGRCRKVPKEVLKQMEQAKDRHDEERAKMKFGSQKKFFAKIWSRLHDNRPDGKHIKPPPRKPLNAKMNGQMRVSRGGYSLGEGYAQPLPGLAAATNYMSLSGGNLGMMGQGSMMMQPGMMMMNMPQMSGLGMPPDSSGFGQIQQGNVEYDNKRSFEMIGDQSEETRKKAKTEEHVGI